MSYETILRELLEHKREAERAANERRRHALTTIPSFRTVEEQIAKATGDFALSQLALTDRSVKQRARAEAAFNKRLKTLQERRAGILADHGMSEHDFLPRYRCDRCSDTGYLADKSMCSCLKQRHIEDQRHSYHLAHLLERENFDTFDPKHFSEKKCIRCEDGTMISQAESMLRHKQFALRFVERFPHGQSMILFGGTGLGKTFLCNCIAKAILEAGHTVVYHSAVQLSRLFKENSSFDRDPAVAAAHRNLFESDLLIIDDLGAERATEFTISELYDIIDTRLITGKSLILSANLSVPDIRDIYGERIYSRFQKYIWLKFYGDDTRA